MRIQVHPSAQATITPSTAIVVPVYQDAEHAWGHSITESDARSLGSVAKDQSLTGKAEEAYVLTTPESPYRCVIVVGLGSVETFDAEVMRRCAGQVCSAAKSHKIGHLVFDVSEKVAIPVEAFIEGIMLGNYDFTTYKAAATPPPVTVNEISIIVPNDETIEELRTACERTMIVCRNVNWARDLANSPPNDMTPTDLAMQAESFAKELNLTCTIFDDAKLKAEKMNGILSVSQGSSEEARLIILEYRHEKATQTLALVGKGVTFDTGGISLKAGVDMHEMKFDMCGAAAVLGAMRSIGELKPEINVIGVVPSAENKTGPEAYVPGDIITMYNGKTVEVHNTDAEGRMLLADALAYTEKTYSPDAMVDLATLTGAVVVALGNYAAGLFSNDDSLVNEIEIAADASGERVWHLPLWDDYCKLVEGTHADLCNIGPRGEAGSITAAAFLKNFVDHTRWAHVDIAGTAWGAKNISYLNPKHAAGAGVRLVTQWVLNQSTNHQ